MKKVIFNKSFWQSFLSAFVLVVFAYIAMATFGGISQQKYQLPDGRWEISKHYSDGNTETTTGNVDGEGRWDGPVKVEYENDNYMLTHTEEVNMKEGKRHGISKVTYPNGYVASYCYQHGERVAKENCEKSATIEANELSAYDIFSYEAPWFVFKLNALGYDTNYVQAYLDTIETILYTTEFGEEDFSDNYDDVINILEETVYDSIIQLNNELSIYNGLDLIQNHEFRLATIHSYRESDGNTYQVVKSIYPNYLLSLSEGGVTDSDFEGFCYKYDSIMSSNESMSSEDPYFIDSLDVRMFRAVEEIYSIEEESAITVQALKSVVLTRELRKIQSENWKYLSQFQKQIPDDNSPEDVASVVLSSFLIKFVLGDLIRNAVEEAYLMKKGVVRLATATTMFFSNNSSTSVTINGNVIDDGGGEVTSRGIAWGTIYNPTIHNQILTNGSGTGDFVTDITDLTEGQTYYARTYATNSAGTAYGNCINFVATKTTGINDDNLSGLSFEVYPNPGSENVTIRLNAEFSKNMVFTVFDVDGKVVLKKELSNISHGENRISLNLSGMRSGLYFCQIKGDENVYATQKLVINR